MSERALLKIEILSWWRSGGGAGREAQLDAVCARDADELPYLPGRQIKGLLRHAALRLHGEALTERLFGSRGFGAPREGEEDPRWLAQTRPGLLAFTDARMAAAERAAFKQDEATRALLFETLRSTAMDAGTGVAREKSLRSEEVAIPMTLEAEIELIGAEDDLLRAAGGWRAALEEALPLIRGVGAKTQRGLGRARLTLGARP